LLEMRLVEHLAVERGDAGAGGESGDHFLGVFDVGGGRREGGVDRLDLVGMDRQHAGEAFALGQARGALQAGAVRLRARDQN